jgi:hypothetical protein
MNWLLMIVLAVLAFCIYNGYRRGFLRMIYSLVSWMLVLAFVTWATPYINSLLLNYTNIYEGIQSTCEARIRESAQEKTKEQLEDEKPLAELGIKLPDSVTEKILDTTVSSADEFMESSGIYKQVAAGVADFILEGISFFLAAIGASILAHLISRILGIVSRIPILKGANRILGVFAGGVYGLILVWIAFYILALCGTSDAGKILLSYVYESSFLTYLYENNAVLTVVLYFL